MAPSKVAPALHERKITTSTADQDVDKGASRARPLAGRVVVGVDDSAGGRAALEFAVVEAAVRNAELHVIHAWTMPGAHTGHAQMAGPLREAVVDDARAFLDRLAVEVLGADPGLSYVLTVGEPPPTQALIDASRHADLVVVGGRGRGGFAGLLIGSVTSRTVRHAHCPVVVVHPPDAAPGAPGIDGPDCQGQLL